MSKRVVLLGTLAAVLLAGGYWLGQASSASAPAPAPTTAARSASLPAITVAPAPVIEAPVAKRVDPTLVADLADPDPKVRRAAMHEAVRAPDVDVQMLLGASRDADLEVAGLATIALADAYARGDVPAAELVARATDSALHEKVRSVALNGLGQVASTEAFTLLADLATRGSTAERAAAAILLRNQDADRAMPVLIAMLGDSDAHVRDCAHDSLKARARGRDFGEDRGAWQAWWTSRR